MIGTVLPGVSTSFILINMNVYKSFMEVFTKFLSNPGQNIVLGLSSIAGILVVAIPMLLIVRKVLNRFHRQSFYTLFGILLATIVGCVIQEVMRNQAGIGFLRIVVLVVLLPAVLQHPMLWTVQRKTRTERGNCRKIDCG